MKPEEMEQVLKVGVLLSEEQDLNHLLEQILSCVMDLAHCDAGTLYLRDGDVLRFKIMRTDSLGIRVGGDGTEPDLAPVPIRRENVCAFALLENRTICIGDVRTCRDYDFSGPIRYDEATGYRTTSMLVVPMRNRRGETLGVLQLINALDETGAVCAFSPDMALVLESIASQAAITIQNVRYRDEIKALFWAFVQVMSTAINKRTPYNVRHSEHMAALGARLADYLNTTDDVSLHFSPAKKEEFLMSIWLHDIGKVIIPLEVMDKAERLLPEQKQAFFHRMERIRLLGKIDCLSGNLTADGYEELVRQTREAEELAAKAGSAEWLSDDMLSQIDGLAARTYADEDGCTHPWLAPDEHAMLSIRKGTLSGEERGTMNRHVSITDELLGQIPFSSEFSHVRAWAAGHHELLDGQGYPNGLAGNEIPPEVRLITILDIYDSLVADDRPYKPAKTHEQAIRILTDMAEREGKLDPVLLGLFVESRCWEEQRTE